MKKLILSYWLSLRSRLSMFKLVSGILLALTMAFLFYFFSCALMEAFRLMSITPENDIWRPSVEERNFYQLVFAFISTILAQLSSLKEPGILQEAVLILLQAMLRFRLL